MIEAPTKDALIERMQEARQRLQGVAHRTPVATSATLERRTGAQVFLKCENLQRMGAFKFRGAYHFISRLSDADRQRGVVAFSSGNHAQAVALVARLHGAPATIVMPSVAPWPKLEATRGYGAEVVFYDQAGEERQAMAERLARERGRTLVPPFDHHDIVTGQGTAAWELIEETGPLDLLLVPVGGGGLISGCALAAKHLSPRCRVVGVEPRAGDDGVRSFKAGQLVKVEHPDTIADGARTPALGNLTFELIRRSVDDMVSVEDIELKRAMRFVWERMKLIVEPTGVLGLAALMSGMVEARGRKVGVILSGGNVDPAEAARWFAEVGAS
ncbi:MAG TPA: threo-3-hydroxy-L-aspartate ammonia-lyase [Candidatus Eisenbacteria bacterium]|nr:threo-3-hydroxy-L-aspartate ammonia-lyase [Candidatus Eisenbacteria bacterium]